MPLLKQIIQLYLSDEASTVSKMNMYKSVQTS